MEPSPTALQFLFNGQLHYDVPTYQRPYEWDTDRFTEFWEDAGAVYKTSPESLTKPHFMGVIIIERLTAMGPGGSINNNIIDGQQRLLTFLICLAAVRDHFEADADVAVRVKQILSFEGSDSNPHLRVQAQVSDRSAIDDCIGGRWRLAIPNQVIHHRVAVAYRFFRYQLYKGRDTLVTQPAELPSLPSTRRKDQQNIPRGIFPFSGWEDLGEPIEGLSLLTIITQKLMLLQILITEADEDAAIVFQAINGRRTELTQFDHVRNSVFVMLPTAAQHLYDDLWLPMERRLASAKLPNAKKAPSELFLETFLIERGHKVTSKTLNAGFKDMVRNEISAHISPEDRTTRLALLLAEMSQGADLFRMIVGKNDRMLGPGGLLELSLNDSAAMTLQELRIMSAGPAFPVIQHMLKAWLQTADSDALSRGVGHVVSFLVRRAIVGLPQSPLRSFFAEVARTMSSASDPMQLLLTRLTDPKPGCPDDVEVLSALMTSDLYGRLKPIQVFVVLRRAEMGLRPLEYPVMEFGTQGFTIEHLLPQNKNRPFLPKSWAEQATDWGLDAEQVGELLARRHRLGNLTLTKFNAVLGNKSLAEKQSLLKEHSGLSLHSGFLPPTTRWTTQEIDSRGQSLAALVIQQWPRPPRPDTAS